MRSVMQRVFTVSMPLDNFFSNVVAGLVLAFLEIMLSFSLASLLFSGPLEIYLAQGVGIMLLTISLAIFTIALVSGKNQIFPSAQSSIILILAAISGTIVIAPDKSLLPTMLVVISAAAILMGIVLYFFGRYKLTKFIRYVPYPVIGGFLAGNGVLLIKGAIEVMTSARFSFAMVGSLLDASMLMLWLPGVLVAVVLFGSLRLRDNTLLLPGVLILSVVAIFGVITVSGLSVDEASSRGILLGDIGAIQWTPLTNIDFGAVDWGAITSQSGNIITLIMIALIQIPLNLTGVEHIKQSDIDIDHEVQSNGIMNMIVGILGGTVSFSSVTMTAMNHRLHGTNRAVHIIAASVILALLFFGSALLAYVPVAVLGGLLIFLGIEFIDTWVVQGYRKFTQLEYAVALGIMVTVVFVGFIEGVVLGIFVMMLVFVGTYSRISIVYRAASAGNLSSTVERSPHFMEALKTLRNQVYVLELTGFLFFGTADSIVNEVKARLDNPDEGDLSFFIIDFRRVAGVDSSALQSLNKVITLAETNNFTVIFSNFENNDTVKRIVEDLSQHDNLMFTDDLDHAIEHCENELLEQSGTTKTFIPTVIWMQLTEMGMNKKQAKAVQKYMERSMYEPDKVIIEQGVKADYIYFIEIGQVSIYLDYDSPKPIRLRSLGMGTVVGEVGFFLNGERSATVVSDILSYIWSLSKESLERMKEEDAELALAFEATMLRVVAERLTTNNSLLEALR